MNRDILRQVIIDQREMYLNARIVHREYKIEDGVNCCFVGIRRAGKSTLMYQRIQELMDRGVPIEKILYVNFEDERLIEMKATDLNLILEIGYEISGGEKAYLFLDEIQNIDGWSKFARRIADQKYTVYITGSNSRMLSREIASTLGGRYMIVPVYPYSFREYLAANGKEVKDLSFLGTKQKAEIMRLYSRYLQFGAFPELAHIKNGREYLNSIYQTIYLGDIITRNHISSSFAVRLMLKKIAESIGQPLSFTRIFNILTGAGLKISKQTVITYMDAILESCLLFSVQNYTAILLEKETSPKYYFMDTGFPGLLLLDCYTAQLENLVAIELVRRYGVDQVYYFRKNVEIDFYIPEARLAIQVCWSMLQDENTKQRETQSLAKLHQFMPDAKCIVITNSEKAELDIGGLQVSVVPAWEWLLGE
jgi:predicted AAA+ superfamily ATPase